MPLILVVATVVQLWAGTRHLPRGLGGREAPRDEHEHARRPRHRRGLRLQRVRHPVARPGPALGAAAAPLLRDRADRGRAGADGALARAQGQEAHRRLDPGARRRWPRTTARVLRGGEERRRPGRPRSSSATSCGCGPARSCRSTASSPRARSAVDESMLTGESVPVEKAVGDAVDRRHAQHAPAPSSSAPPRSAPTARSPRSCGSSRTRRAPPPRCSGWPTGCPRGSCRPCCWPRWSRSSAG